MLNMHRLVVVGILKCIVTHAEVTYRGHQVWRVEPLSEQVLNSIKDLGAQFQLDFWREPSGIGRAIDFRLPPNQVRDVQRKLNAIGITNAKVILEDVQDLIDREKVQRELSKKAHARSVKEFDYFSYHTAEEVYAWMNMVVEEFPNRVNMSQIGTTYEGRPIYVLKFTGTSASPKPIIFLDSLIHSREWITVASVLYILKEMLVNEKYADMIEDVDWYVIPMINVDGYVKTWTTDRLWRRTASDGASSSCKGVDANRNWDAHWSTNPGASPEPCSSSFYGPAAHSESEIRHLANYILGFGEGKIDAYISTHSAAEMILYPYGYTFDLPEDNTILNVTGKLMYDAVLSVNGKKFVYGPIAETIYPASGSTTDWTYDVAKTVLSYTYELRDREYGHVLPPEFILPSGKEHLAGLVALKKYVTDNFNR